MTEAFSATGHSKAGQAIRGTSWAVLDFETATPEYESACALGLTLVDGGEPSQPKGWLLKPPGNQYDQRNIKIHRIIPSFTVNEPTLGEAWPDICALLEDRVLVAHNADFDLSVLVHSLKTYGIDFDGRTFVCTLALARKAFPGQASYSLPAMASQLGVSFSHHNPVEDAKAAASLAQAFSRADGYDILLTSSRLGVVPGETSVSLGRSHRYVSWPAPVSGTEGHADHYDLHQPLFGRTVAFTGELDSMTRAEAAQAVADAGGHCVNSVTKRTDYLVTGTQDLRALRPGDTESTKMHRFHELRAQGCEIEAISERDLLNMLASEARSASTREAGTNQVARVGNASAQFAATEIAAAATAVSSEHSLADGAPPATQFNHLSVGTVLAGVRVFLSGDCGDLAEAIAASGGVIAKNLSKHLAFFVRGEGFDPQRAAAAADYGCRIVDVVQMRAIVQSGDVTNMGRGVPRIAADGADSDPARRQQPQVSSTTRPEGAGAVIAETPGAEERVKEGLQVPQVVAAWYTDPLRRHQYRYWSGALWTGHVADNGVQGWDPLPTRWPTSSEGPASHEQAHAQAPVLVADDAAKATSSLNQQPASAKGGFLSRFSRHPQTEPSARRDYDAASPAPTPASGEWIREVEDGASSFGFRRTSDGSTEVTVVYSSGDDNLHVVGTSHYQPGIARVRQAMTGDGQLVALIIPEPDNHYDQGAIAVFLVGHGVEEQAGYLTRDDAHRLRAGLLKRMGPKYDRPVAVGARIVGGGVGQEMLGVYLKYDASDF